MKKLFTLLLLALTLPALANTRNFGWETGTSANTASSTPRYMTVGIATDAAYEGSRSMKMTKTGTSTGDRSYVAEVSGLNAGDQVTASVMLKYHGSHSLGVRFWATGYTGSGGPSTGITSTSWTQQSFTWTATGGTTPLKIEVRAYGAVGDYGYADALSVSFPAYATIVFPDGTEGINPDAGSPTVAVPNVVGMSQANAQAALSAEGFSVSATEQYSDTVAAGFVISQSPEAGSDAPEGSTISIIVSMGQEPGVAVYNYGWENGGTDLGTYDKVTSINDHTQSNSGSRSLKIIRGDGGTTQTFVAWVTGLTNGQQVTASAYMKYASSGSGMRFWGHYNSGAGEAADYDASAGGASGYYKSADWGLSEYTWTVDRDGGLTIQVRMYSGEGDHGWVDDLEITVPETAQVHFPAEVLDPICVTPGGDFTGDCKVDFDDFNLFASQWLCSGIDNASADPNYAVHTAWDWSAPDPNELVITTYPADITSYQLVSDPEAISGNVLQLTQTSDSSYGDEFTLARIEGLEDGDKVLVMVRMKQGNTEGVTLGIISSHIRNGAYAGSKISSTPRADEQWGTYYREVTFDVGDISQYDPRTGLDIGVNGYRRSGYSFAPGQILGYVDEIIISAPYREDQYGMPTVSVEFPKIQEFQQNFGYSVDSSVLPDICIANPAADATGDCYVTIEDYAVMAFTWGECGWDDPALCDN